ncbi:CRISPR-associated helicase Cas3' [Ectothiorhodospira shaposhnikovii]|uniref:CRISPR-associated helicase Cas3' n=1 Tax=Ectothiorhodospira shaposhnikovii TaxID=1054 RepID=UPI001EE907F3|nr:CRISPR-associated helicase Cas3' [Ectothiorhodospira shaposhnikovii]MCG5511693.1 CRISPR-associated helicase Cas3' [Ectothiorhodospira shaposhnikovii]
MLRKRVSRGSECRAVSFEKCPAKTYQRVDGVKIEGHSVLEHCQIVGEVARALIARYPSVLRNALFPPGAEMAASGHDIGKVSPCFYEKLRRACSQGQTVLEPLPNINPDLEKQWGGHAGVSQVTAKALDAPPYVAEILGQHHGFSPPVAGLKAGDDIFGGPLWQQERAALVAKLKTLLDSDWPLIESVSQARLLAGLTSVADWIGSGSFFEDPAQPWRERIEPALDDAGFIRPDYQTGLSFEQLFGFTPYPAQQQLIDAVAGPGVYVLEAPMGVGKTEASLYVAYRMLAGGQASGIYFALPTQLTSNKIYERFNEFLKGILAPQCRHRTLLLHGKNWLMDTEMGEEGGPGGAWFNQAKRGLLAPFAVGTIDQALMAAMNVKHGFVRAFGLAGKVVILDEVHTYDAYTSTLLNALVELLRELHCTVIILSATLNRERRQQLAGAVVRNESYPLITAVPRRQPVSEWPVPSGASHTVNVHLRDAQHAALAEALDRASRGQQVLWIENTVVEAQERYLDLAARAAELGVACGLLHSRFTAEDRQRIEASWVSLFGKRGWQERTRQGRILVGTQILEQSLDIDADFLVSRFAPTDMLLQRLGRLWRHIGTPREPEARCEAWILAPDLAQAIDAPLSAFGSSAHVYSAYVLCRSLEVWQGIDSLRLPQDIRALIEQTYAQRQEDGAMARWLHELDNGTPRRKGRRALAQLARVTLAEDGKNLSDSEAQTRHSESEGEEVLLLRATMPLPEQRTTRLILLDGRQLLLPWDRHKLDKRGWRELSVCLMRQIVPVPVQAAPECLPVDTLKKMGLQHCFYLGNPVQEESVLRVVLVDETSVLQGLQGAQVHRKHILEYRDDLGYRVIKEHG